MTEVQNRISKKELLNALQEEIRSFRTADLYEMHLDKEKLLWVKQQKEALREDLSHAMQMDGAAKERILIFMERCLEEKYFSKEDFWNRVWYFTPESLMTEEVQFELALYRYEQKYGAEGFLKWFSEEGYCFYSRKRGKTELLSAAKRFSETEKRQLLLRVLYRESFGLGKLETLLPFSVDGISCGLNEEDGSYPFWVMLQGSSIPLRFYQCEKRELQQVARRLASSCGCGEFHEERGYCVGDLRNRMRAIILRPPFAEDWTFFLRKYDSVGSRRLEDLIQGEGCEDAIRLLKMIVLGSQTAAITGMQGSGKTTLLMGMIEEIPQEYTLRVLEQIFELHLRKLYPQRNVLTVRETETISGEEGLNLLKKTDGNVTIIGEVASAKVAAWMIDAGQVASLFTLFTHHAKTMNALVSSLRNSLLSEGLFSDEAVAERQVVDVVRFDIHLVKDRKGKRYISRISEILRVPGGYQESVLLRYQDGSYVRKNAISYETLCEMEAFLTEEEKLRTGFERELCKAEEVLSHERVG